MRERGLGASASCKSCMWNGGSCGRGQTLTRATHRPERALKPAVAVLVHVIRGRNRDHQRASLPRLTTTHLNWRNPVHRHALVGSSALGTQLHLHVFDAGIPKLERGLINVQDINAYLTARFHRRLIAGSDEGAAAAAPNVVAPFNKSRSTCGRLASTDGYFSVFVLLVSQTALPLIDGSAPHAFNSPVQFLVL